MNPITLAAGAMMSAASSAFVGGAVNTASNLFYGGEGEGSQVATTTTPSMTSSMVTPPATVAMDVSQKSNKDRIYMSLFAFLIISVIVLIVFIVLHHTSINEIKKDLKDLKVIKDKNKELVDMTNKNLSSVKKIITKVNSIGTRIGTTDLTFKYEILPEEKSAAIKNTFGGKNDFVQIPYQNELNLFKTLSPEDQYEYLHMDKTAKRAKYSNML